MNPVSYLTIASIVPIALFAQPPAILSIAGLAGGDTRFSPYMPAELHYSPSRFNAVSDKVLVNGRSVSFHDEEDGQSLVLFLPADVPLGPATVVLQTTTGNSEPFPIQIDTYSPSIFPPGPSPFFSSWTQPLTCNHTAVAGDILFLFVTGLGAPDAAGAVAKPTILVGGKAVSAIELVPSVIPGLGFEGVGAAYRLEFVVPPGDGMREVAVSVGGIKSNGLPLPVGRAIRNLSALSFSEPHAAAPQSILAAIQCSSEGFTRGPDIVWGALPDLETSLAGVSIVIKDSAGVERLAPLYGVSLSQINYVVPAGTAPGLATVTATVDRRPVGQADLEIEAVAPDLFQGQIQVVRLRAGIQTVEQTSKIDMGPLTDDVCLVLYGSGIRSRSSLENVSASIAGMTVPVLYAGAQGQLPGVDQLNFRLPHSLAGAGATLLELAIDGKRVALPLFFQ
jgi:uncharacterized protein (TIGR03437 family)